MDHRHGLTRLNEPCWPDTRDPESNAETHLMCDRSGSLDIGRALEIGKGCELGGEVDSCYPRVVFRD